MKKKLSQKATVLIILFVFVTSLFIGGALFYFFFGERPEAQPTITPPLNTGLLGSFTELFSGEGWKDRNLSNAFQDMRSTTVSFKPVFRWSEIPDLSRGLGDQKIIAGKTDGGDVVLVSSGGDMYLWGQDEKVEKVDLTKGGNYDFAALDYDKATKNWGVALVSEKKVLVEIVDPNEKKVIGQEELSLDNLKIAGNARPLVIDVSCLQGECYLLAGENLQPHIKSAETRLYKFLSSSDPTIQRVKKYDYWFDDPDFQSVGIGKTSNSWLFGIVRKSPDGYRGDVFQAKAGKPASASLDFRFPLFNSTYAGTIYFGYDEVANEEIAVYGAYMGQAFKFGMDKSGIIDRNTVSDYSRFFEQRIMGSAVDGVVNVVPTVFPSGGTWWIGSSPISPVPKLIRILNGVENDLTSEVLKNSETILSIPSLRGNAIYGIVWSGGSNYVYRLINLGFDDSKMMVWESSRINVRDGWVMRASVNPILAGGYIKYFLSNNGGGSWQPVEPNQVLVFPEKGGDLRWKAEMYPFGGSYKSPWIDILSVEYEIKP